MPTYEYACTTCGKEFELIQSIKADALKTCNCGLNGVVRRKIGRGAGLIFKGSGFYETDYRRKPVAPASESGSAPSTTPATAPASEPKSAPQSDAKPSPTVSPPSSNTP